MSAEHSSMEGMTSDESKSVMEEVSSEQKAYLRTDKISRPFLTEEIKQFSLKKTPKTLKEFYDLFLVDGTDDTLDNKRLIWITRDSCVSAPDLYELLKHEKDAFEAHFVLSIDFWKASDESGYDTLEVYSETEIGALSILEMFCDLSDEDYRTMCLCNRAASFPGNLPCPFDRILVSLMCRDPLRQEFEFSYIDFRSEDFGHVLTTRGGMEINLRFESCAFEDDGASFAQDLKTRLDGSDDIAELEFTNSFPEELIYSLDDRYRSLDLSFFAVNFNIRQCQALASAEIRNLVFHDCTFEDGGQLLVDSAVTGRGPRGWRYSGSNYLFDTMERALSFFTALESNEHLQVLDLHGTLCKGLDYAKALAGALRRNKTLTTLKHNSGDKQSWLLLFDAIATHPALRDIGFCTIKGESEEELTEAMVKMAKTSTSLEEIYFEASWSTINIEVFDRRVVPELECNQFRKLLIDIQDIKGLSTRAGTVAEALFTGNEEPSFIYMLLRQNIDSLVMAHTNEGGLNMSRKRKHV